MTKEEIKIVSGGQTGVDQGALAAAIDLGLDWGGWAPKGWRSENGTIGEKYRVNMLEHASSNYLGRTRRNVADSNATLIITNTYPLTGGTLKTRFFRQELMRSHFVVSLDEADAVSYASQSMGLNQLKGFEPTQKWICLGVGVQISTGAPILKVGQCMKSGKFAFVPCHRDSLGLVTSTVRRRSRRSRPYIVTTK